MVLVKTKLQNNMGANRNRGKAFGPFKKRNKMGDRLLDDCLVIFIERDIFFKVDEDDVIKTFMSLEKRQIKSSEK
jgi:hypothetical protein